MKKNKNFMKLKRIGSGYSHKESSEKSYNLENLRTFLSYELYSKKVAENWKKKIMDNEYQTYGGNETFMLKENEKVSLLSEFNDIELSEDWFTTTRKDMIRIIDEWFDLIKKQPLEIIILEDESGKITMEGHDEQTPFWNKEKFDPLKIVPRFFIIKIETIGHPKEGIDLEYTMTNVLKNRLDKKIGEVWFETIRGTLGLRSEPKCRYIFAIKYDKQKTILDIANQFPEFKWEKEFGGLVWNKDDTEQTFFDKKIEKVEIYTQN